MSEFDRIVYQNGRVKLGLWRLAARHPRFEDTGPIENYVLVFPGTRVVIEHAGGAPIRTDPTLVLFYNRDQVYRRGRISPEGDLADWIAVPPEWVIEAARPFDPGVVERADRPFRLTHGPGSDRGYLLGMILTRLARRGVGPPWREDDLEVEETVAAILADAVAAAYIARGVARPRGSPATAKSHADLVERARDILARTYTENLPLAALARAAAASPFHLCRIFRRHTGRTLHDYRHALRLRAALDAVAQGTTDLAALALDLGYSSHSHLTQAFRASFGVAPAGVRRTLASRRIGELSRILTA